VPDAVVVDQLHPLRLTVHAAQGRCGAATSTATRACIP
jgi:hypothetical protein